MVFSNSTSKQGLIEDTDFWSGTNSSNYPTVDKTRNLNAWYSRVVSWIWQAVGDWEYDDSNYTSLPIAKTDLVASQADYELPSTAQKLLRVQVLNVNGDWSVVNPIDQSQRGDAMEELYSTTGLPEYYDVIGNSLVLYPSPDSDHCTLTSGLEIYCSRDVDYFAATDTTQEPGFTEMFHRILSLGAALDYCIAKGKIDLVPRIRDEIERMRADLEEYYSSRHRNFKTKLVVDIDEESIL